MFLLLENLLYGMLFVVGFWLTITELIQICYVISRCGICAMICVHYNYANRLQF